MTGIAGPIGAIPLVAGVAVVFAAAALMTSFFAVWRTRSMVNASESRLRAAAEESDAALHNCREALSGLAAQVRELPQQVSTPAVAATPRPGLNLSKRSRVLRMHRLGDSPEQIAIALEVPLQEVDLLLKVQRIVLKSL